MSSLVCPKCGGVMSAASALHPAVSRCESCSGLWFTAAEAGRRVDDAASLDTGSAADGARFNDVDRINCPFCETHPPLIRMVDPDQAHIEFESCMSCYGRFYDAGEYRDFADVTWREYFFGSVRDAPRD